jgi:hypothetical protein
VDTIRDPLLVLDQDLRGVTANRTFHQTFRMSRQDIQSSGLRTGRWPVGYPPASVATGGSRTAARQKRSMDHFAGLDVSVKVTSIDSGTERLVGRLFTAWQIS